MGTRDKRVDAYIAKSADFAKPVLVHVRELMHATCPDVEETLKWGHPAFMYHGILGGIASFKEHASFGFWKESLILGRDGSRSDEAFGSFGKLKSVKDLPPKKTLAGYITKAMQLNEEGTRVAKPKSKPKPPVKTPPYLAAALKKNKKAFAQYEAFSPGMRREYVEWLEEAKTDATRDRRLATAVEWMAEGKQRNWKYQNC